MSREIKVALLMAASLFMDVMDGTIVTTALPKMAQNFNVSAATISLLVSTYMIAVAVFIPLSGWIAQRLGNKRIWLLAVALFTVSSLGSALAPNFAVLLTMRVIQGIAGAMMTPTARLIVLEKTPANQLLRMISYLVWPSLVAPALAPVIGGMFVTYFTWHWIFLINLPIGIIAFLIGLHLLPKDEVKQARAFDVRGFIELALASVALLAGAAQPLAPVLGPPLLTPPRPPDLAVAPVGLPSSRPTIAPAGPSTSRPAAAPAPPS